MGINKLMNQLNIYKEFWKLAGQANDLAETGDYDVDMLISAWRHQLTASNFFYGTLVNNEANHNASRTFYSLKTETKEHQLVYCQIGRNYPKELFDPHWCYVLKHSGTKLIVIPVTSIKPDSGPASIPYEYDIEEDNNIIGRMHFDEIRCVDKMRIIEKKGYINVVTPRVDIETAVLNFFNFTKNTVDADHQTC